MKSPILFSSVYLIIIFGLGLFFSSNEKSGEHSSFVDHSLFQQVLEKRVVGDQFDYSNLKEDSLFKSYFGSLEKVNPFAPNWSKSDQLSYWINCYNASVINLIGENQTQISSIKDIDDCWDRNVIRIHGRNYSLAQIEHSILRRFNDPRIHFSIVCGAKSCPVLDPAAFFSEDLSRQLDRKTKQFINDKRRNKLSTNKVHLSKIFRWFRSDFTTTNSLIEFINEYAKVKINKNADIAFLEYDWSLNSI